MLWLAGLMGVLGVSAASFIVSQPEEDPDEDTPDEGFDEPSQSNRFEVNGVEHTLGPDASGNLFQLSPDIAENTNDLSKENYLFGPPQQDGVRAESVRPPSPDIDRLQPLDVLGQDKDLFIDRLPSDKEPLFPDNDINSYPRELWANPLSGALGKEMLNEPVYNLQPGTFEHIEDGAFVQPFEGIQDLTNGDVNAEPFSLEGWLLQGQTAEVLDYEAGQDSLMLVWDDTMDDAREPQVAVANDPFDTEVRHVLLNGRSVAEVYGDPVLETSDVTLIPLSSAVRVGIEPI